WFAIIRRGPLVVGTPHDQALTVGEDDLLPERLAPRLFGRSARHDEGLDRRKVDDRPQLVQRELGIPQVNLGRLFDTGVRRPVLRYAHGAPSSSVDRRASLPTPP